MLTTITTTVAGYLLMVGSLLNAGGQVLVIDSRHLMAGKTGKQAKAYVIKPTHSLVIDYSGYKFLPGKNGKIKHPDTISIIVDNKRQYFYKITGTHKRHTLSARTLIHRKGYESFTGLREGDKFILAIGNLAQSKNKDKQIFQVAWIGLVKVSGSPGN